ITRVTRGDGSWLSYEYDDARRLVAIGNNLGERLEYDVEKRGQIYFYYSNFSNCAHAELLKANNSLNHAPLPRHREVTLRHLLWSLHARKIRVEKINLSPLCSVTGRVVAVGTRAYRPLDVIPDDEMQHGVYGSHHNIFVAKQAPRGTPRPCKCQWVKQNYVLKPHELTPDMIPIEPFSD
ncbi:hypothetical protein ACSEP8_10400, partial [Pseudomonas aeruginosa]